MKRIFLNGCYGACNLGDDIMMQIVVDDIQKILNNKDFVIYIKNKGQKKCLIQNNPSIENISKSNKLDELKLIKKADFYIWGGGTFLYESTDNGIKSLLSILLHILVAKFYKTQIILYGIGFGPFKSFFGKKVAQAIIKLSDFITVRDQESFLEIAKINKKSFLTNDLVYRLDNSKFKAYDLNKNKKHILLNTVYHISSNEVDKFANLILNKLNELEIDFKSIHLHLIPAWESQKSSDSITNKILLDILLKKYDFQYTIYENKSSEELLHILNSVEIVFAQRLHILLIAALMNKRIYTHEYHSKVNKFLIDIGYNDGIYDSSVLEENIKKSHANFEFLKNFMSHIK